MRTYMQSELNAKLIRMLTLFLITLLIIFFCSFKVFADNTKYPIFLEKQKTTDGQLEWTFPKKGSYICPESKQSGIFTTFDGAVEKNRYGDVLLKVSSQGKTLTFDPLELSQTTFRWSQWPLVEEKQGNRMSSLVEFIYVSNTEFNAFNPDRRQKIISIEPQGCENSGYVDRFKNQNPEKICATFVYFYGNAFGGVMMSCSKID